MKAESPPIALIADIVQSRDLPDRARVQDDLRERLSAWSRRLARQTFAPLALTAGDEFEALFHTPRPIFHFVREFSDQMQPIRLRFGLGRGGLTTPVPESRRRRRVAELDGPAFHRARSALERAKRDDLWLAVEGWGERDDAVLGALASLIDVVRSGWTKRQAEIVEAARSQLQKDVATALDVSPSVVSESLKAAHFQRCLKAEAALALGIGGPQVPLE